MFIECPRCRSRYNVPSYSNDFVCQCSDFPLAGSVVAFDDIPLVGKWTDYTGSSSDPSLQLNVQDMVNGLIGTRASEIDGAILDNKTPRGNNASTTRERAHEEYIQLK